MFVDLAEDPPRGDHVEKADDDARVLPTQVSDRIRRVGEEGLPGHYLDARLFTVRF